MLCHPTTSIEAQAALRLEQVAGGNFRVVHTAHKTETQCMTETHKRNSHSNVGINQTEIAAMAESGGGQGWGGPSTILLRNTRWACFFHHTEVCVFPRVRYSTAPIQLHRSTETGKTREFKIDAVSAAAAAASVRDSSARTHARTPACHVWRLGDVRVLPRLKQ